MTAGGIPRGRQLPALTGIRFFLALWVVIYHQIPPVEQIVSWRPALHSLQNVLRTGYCAVTAFFILSGFVLAYNYSIPNLRGDRLRRFAAARFSRIYPAYLAGLLILLPLALYRLASSIEIAPPATEWGNFVLNLFLLQAWSPHAALSWNFPGWSLSNEAFFYACFPLLGWFWSQGKIAWFRTLLLLWGLSCAAPLIAAWIPVYHWGDLPATTDVLPPDVSIWANIIRYNPLLRLPEFCVGIVLARVYQELPTDSRWHARGGAAFLLGVASTLLILSFADHIAYPLLHNGLLIPCFACMIFGLALAGGGAARLLAQPLFIFLGNASYTMYILHAPLYSWLMIFFRRVLQLPPQGWLWFASYVTVVITVSSAFYAFIEEPLHVTLRAQLNARLQTTSRIAG